MYYVVVDGFGFQWGDLVETREEAMRQKAAIIADCKERGFDYDDFSIEIRKG